MTGPEVDAGPLSGFRIVDLTENMAGPMATMVLGDQGADVVKVESLWGDQIRRTQGCAAPEAGTAALGLCHRLVGRRRRGPVREDIYGKDGVPGVQAATSNL